MSSPQDDYVRLHAHIAPNDNDTQRGVSELSAHAKETTEGECDTRCEPHASPVLTAGALITRVQLFSNGWVDESGTEQIRVVAMCNNPHTS